MLILSLREEEEEEDPVAKAEDDFWHVIGLEKKGIDTREKKRQEALMTLNQPTPIPEETSEVIQSEDKVQWNQSIPGTNTSVLITGVSSFQARIYSKYHV